MIHTVSTRYPIQTLRLDLPANSLGCAGAAVPRWPRYLRRVRFAGKQAAVPYQSVRLCAVHGFGEASVASDVQPWRGRPVCNRTSKIPELPETPEKPIRRAHCLAGANVASESSYGVEWPARSWKHWSWLMVWNIFYFPIYSGWWSNLTNIFHTGWNHQTGSLGSIFHHLCAAVPGHGTWKRDQTVPSGTPSEFYGPGSY